MSVAVVLAHFDPEYPVELSVDAIPYDLGAVIMHVYPNGNRRSIAYASQTLNELSIRFVPSKRNHDCPCPPRLTKRMLYIEWKNVWFTR